MFEGWCHQVYIFTIENATRLRERTAPAAKGPYQHRKNPYRRNTVWGICQNMISQNWVCLVWTLLVDPVGVFCPLLGPLNAPITKITINFRNFVFLFSNLDVPYIPFKGPYIAVYSFTRLAKRAYIALYNGQPLLKRGAGFLV